MQHYWVWVKPTNQHKPHRSTQTFKKILYNSLLRFFSNVSNTDPTDLQKEYLFSIWSNTDHTDLSKLAY